MARNGGGGGGGAWVGEGVALSGGIVRVLLGSFVFFLFDFSFFN